MNTFHMKKKTQSRLQIICQYHIILFFARYQMMKLFIVRISYHHFCVSVKMRPSDYFVSPHSPPKHFEIEIPVQVYFYCFIIQYILFQFNLLWNLTPAKHVAKLANIIKKNLHLLTSVRNRYD